MSPSSRMMSLVCVLLIFLTHFPTKLKGTPSSPSQEDQRKSTNSEAASRAAPREAQGRPVTNGKGANGSNSGNQGRSANENEEADSATQDNRGKKSVVFNVWEYARVAGPLPPKPSIESQLQTEQSASTADSGANLSPCVWAIASCCHATSDSRKSRCFDALGCGGAWFSNLCRKELLQEALVNIMQ